MCGHRPGGKVEEPSDSPMLDVKCVTRELWSDPMSMSFSARVGNLLVRILYSRPETGTLPESRKASYSPIFLGNGVCKGWPSSCAHSPTDRFTTSPAGGRVGTGRMATQVRGDAIDSQPYMPAPATMYSNASCMEAHDLHHAVHGST